jgi:organic hydroperoxide reductase OsmC/OhrA
VKTEEPWTGSSINGGELLFAALATCFCNDLYREAAQRGINVQDVDVEVTETFAYLRREQQFSCHFSLYLNCQEGSDVKGMLIPQAAQIVSFEFRWMDPNAGIDQNAAELCYRRENIRALAFFTH